MNNAEVDPENVRERAGKGGAGCPGQFVMAMAGVPAYASRTWLRCVGATTQYLATGFAD